MPSGSTWIIGMIGTWFILTLLADIPDTEELAKALAISIAITATFVLYPDVTKNIWNTGTKSVNGNAPASGPINGGIA